MLVHKAHIPCVYNLSEYDMSAIFGPPPDTPAPYPAVFSCDIPRVTDPHWANYDPSLRARFSIGIGFVHEVREPFEYLRLLLMGNFPLVFF